jgi:hypothetical protein
LVRKDWRLQRFFIHDHEAGWGPDGIHWRGKPPEMTMVGPEQMEGLRDLPYNEWPDSGVWVFRNVEADEILSLAVSKGNIIYVDDEIDLIARYEGWRKSPLRVFVHEGRHALNEAGEPCKLHIYAACRRPQNLHRDITDLADHFYLFRLRGKATLQRIIDDDLVDSLSELETLKDMEKFHFLHWPSGELGRVDPIGEHTTFEHNP